MAADGAGNAFVGAWTSNNVFKIEPDGTITQVLLYWAGGTTGAPGDDMIMIDGPEPGSGRVFDWSLADTVPIGIGDSSPSASGGTS